MRLPASIRFAPSRTLRNEPMTLISNRRRNCCTVVSRKGVVSMTPAAVTSASSPPNVSRTVAKAAAVDASSATSIAIAMLRDCLRSSWHLDVAIQTGDAPTVRHQLACGGSTDAATGSSHRCPSSLNCLWHVAADASPARTECRATRRGSKTSTGRSRGSVCLDSDLTTSARAYCLHPW